MITINDRGNEAFDKVADFLVTCRASELTEALAIVLDVECHRLGNVISQAQYEELLEQNNEASAG